ncbi:hypothetical protein SAMN02745163_02415 [Clostridium cavendishii DSM 21758]|uniref:Serine aminopeptidase S33 domain-containing protein n=1 Tax=Clostridium cavendishii DSM 21758 TaxID=1121302 RepID=A0A1M6LKY6_9CLOT|nr:alpha/beta hydrolase [Clostridium cavendishii]SHJ71864.1 hypothetical protein SAMN02745163_02415 [Clostridium cavendishii DSM 21758]
MIKNKRKIYGIIVAIIVLILVSIIAISVYVGVNLTRPEREEIKDNPKAYGLNYEDINFNSKKDNTLLKGWYISAQNNGQTIKSDKTIIFSHGYGDSRGLYDIKVINLAKTLASKGYNVLTFDFRASGDSEGNFSSIGAFEKYDLLAAIDFAKKDKGAKHIGLIGWSMGATTSILTASESEDVQAVIADSPFSSLKPYLEKNMSYWSGLPDFPFTKIILSTLPLIRGIDINEVDAIKAAKSLGDKKLFLIHSKDDKAIPIKNSEDIYSCVNNKENVTLWTTEKADHIRSYLLYKDEYEKKVVEFLNSNIK